MIVDIKRLASYSLYKKNFRNKVINKSLSHKPRPVNKIGYIKDIILHKNKSKIYS